MEIADEGILVSKTKYGESSLILCFLTKNYGLQRGLLKGGLTSKNKAILEIGNVLSVVKRFRIEENLGFFKIDLLESYLYKIYNDPNKLLALSAICELISEFVLEKEVNTTFYDITKSTITLMQRNDFINYYIKWELLLLEKIGIGLDLSKCAITSLEEGLYYISPRTGKAVIKAEGEKYHDKLFLIPDSFRNQEYDISKESISESFKIINHFLYSFAKEYQKIIPFSRECLISKILKKYS